MTASLTVRDLGEKRIIAEIIRPMCELADVPIGIGDDAAMLSVPAGKSLLVSTDKIPEDLLAVQIGLMDAFHHGRYLATVNISDIAAMGGEPAGLLVTLALPSDFSLQYLTDFYKGLIQGCSEWGIGIVGGDLGGGTTPCFSAVAVGFVEPAQVLRRNGASVGDQVFATGPIGGFNTALLYFIVAKPRGLALSSKDEEYLRCKLVHPIAQVRKGRLLAASGLCRSCMDITDGVARTLFELADCSRKGLAIREDLLPVHPATAEVAEFLGKPARDVVFGIGLDLELLGTIACPRDGLPASLRDELVVIGIVKEEQGNVLVAPDGERIPIPSQGWQHFAGSALDLVKASAPVTRDPAPR